MLSQRGDIRTTLLVRTGSGLRGRQLRDRRDESQCRRLLRRLFARPSRDRHAQAGSGGITDLPVSRTILESRLGSRRLDRTA